LFEHPAVEPFFVEMKKLLEELLFEFNTDLKYSAYQCFVAAVVVESM
jgi:hypothetical protein